MQLLELTPEEVAFLTASPATHDTLQDRLTPKLAAVLTARLRWPVSLAERPAPASGAAANRPLWQIDNALSVLWVTRRLGGQHVGGAAAFVPPSLIQELDATLAECWLDVKRSSQLPASLAWRLASNQAVATLTVQLPQNTTEMTRWAQEAIRHA